MHCGWPIAALDEDLEPGEGITIDVHNELRNTVIIMMREEYTKSAAGMLAAIDSVSLSYSTD